MRKVFFYRSKFTRSVFRVMVPVFEQLPQRRFIGLSLKSGIRFKSQRVRNLEATTQNGLRQPHILLHEVVSFDKATSARRSHLNCFSLLTRKCG